MSSTATIRARKRVASVALTLLVVASLVAGAGVGAAPASAQPTGATPATPVTDCLTITDPGVYELRNDLTATRSACIDIRTSDVTVRGNGHAIDATGAQWLEPVVLAGTADGDLTNVTVTGLSVDAAPRPVLLYNGVTNGTVADVDVTLVDPSARNGRVAVVGNGTVVRNVTGARIYVGGDRNRVLDSSALGVEFTGVTVVGDANALRNVTSQGRPGLALSGEGNDVRGGSFAGTFDGNGVTVVDGEGNSVSAATLRGGPADGVGAFVANSSNTTLSRNAVRGDFLVGVSVAGSEGTVLAGNDFTAELLIGPHLVGTTNATLTRNRLRSPLHLDEGARGNVVYDNLFNVTRDAFDGNVLFGSLNSRRRGPPGVNAWNVSARTGENVVGGSTIGGNYYANPDGTGFSQTCDDADADGLCDSPNELGANNTDFLPLADPTNGTDGGKGSGNGNETTTYQVDFVAGQPIENLSADRLYAQEDRLVRFAFGSTEDGVTERGSAWADESIRNCIDYGHIAEREDGTAAVTFAVAEDCGDVTLSLVVYEMPGERFEASTVDQQVLLNATTGTYGPGEHTITVDLPDGNESDD